MATSSNLQPSGSILWNQADRSTSAVLVVRGVLVSILEEEPDTVTELPMGFLLGEYGLINGKVNLSIGVNNME